MKCPRCGQREGVVMLFDVHPCDKCLGIDEEVTREIKTENDPTGLFGHELHEWMRNNAGSWLRWRHPGCHEAKCVIRGIYGNRKQYYSLVTPASGFLNRSLKRLHDYTDMPNATCTGRYIETA